MQSQSLCSLGHGHLEGIPRWKSNDDGQRFIAIEAFTDDELNYNAGDRILITGVTVTTGPTVEG